MQLNKLQFLSYIKKLPGHPVNSKGEFAPWALISHKTNKVISKHSSKEGAEKALRNAHIFGG